MACSDNSHFPPHTGIGKVAELLVYHIVCCACAACSMQWVVVSVQGKTGCLHCIVCTDFALQNMVETMLPDGLETSGRRVYR